MTVARTTTNHQRAAMYASPAFSLRLDFIAARERGDVSPDEFARVQRTMSGAACEGQAAEMMKAVLDPEAWIKEPF